MSVDVRAEVAYCNAGVSPLQQQAEHNDQHTDTAQSEPEPAPVRLAMLAEFPFLAALGTTLVPLPTLQSHSTSLVMVLLCGTPCP